MSIKQDSHLAESPNIANLHDIPGTGFGISKESFLGQNSMVSSFPVFSLQKQTSFGVGLKKASHVTNTASKLKRATLPTKKSAAHANASSTPGCELSHMSSF